MLELLTPNAFALPPEAFKVLLLIVLALPVLLPLLLLAATLVLIVFVKLLLTALLLLLLPGRKLPAVEVLPGTPALDELKGFPRFPVDVALEDNDDFPDEFDLRCLDDDETLLPPLETLVELAVSVLLVILMLVAEVDAEFMVESISFSGDEHESEEVSCCMGL